MAEISLKTYLAELDNLLENEALEEVIGHCKHILKTYPKNLDTYRILGKALLERHRHQDAADVFQRVLSAEPRDFIAHAGMSIVYEEQDQIDEAIWHMERAFEQEPNNQALQEELRRLYSRRDGYAPPKIQLTAGALATQYAKGGLYAQALNELRQALAENPDRMDLQTLKCECLWLAGEKKQAAEVAMQILDKLPNSLVANRVLGEMWLGYGRAREAEPFLARIEALDTYGLLAIGKGGEPVDPDAVQVARLEWSGAAASLSAGAPDWVAAVGQAFAEAPEEVPEWARDLGEVAGPAMTVEQALQFDMSDLGQDSEAVMPDWMDDLRADVQPAAEAASPFAEDWTSQFDAGSIETALPTGDAADLSWMQGFSEEPAAPAGPGRVPTGLTDQLEEFAYEEPEWLREFTEGEGEAALAEEGGAPAPDWLTGGDLGASAGEAFEAAAPDWMAGSGAEAEGAADAGDWLASMMEGSAGEPAAPSATEWPGEGVDWLMGAAPAPEAEAEPAEEAVGMDWLAAPEAEAEAAPGEIPDWLAGAAPAAEAEPAGEAIGMDWLAGATPAPEAEAEVAPGEIPDWLAGAALAAEAEPAEEAIGMDWLAAPEAEAEAAPGEIPDWLAGAAPAAEAEPAGEAAGMDWLARLDSLRAEAGAGEEAEAGAIPDWLAGAPEPSEGEELTLAAPQSEDWLVGAALEAPVEPGPALWAGVADDEATLAQKAGMAEVPSDQEAGPPGAETGVDWLASLTGAPAGAAEPETPKWTASLPGLPAEGAAPGAEKPEWIARLPDEKAGAEPGAPRWTASLPPLPAEEPVASAESDVSWMAELPAPPKAPEGEGLDWLAGAAPEAEAEIAPGEIPDWLAGAAPAAEAEPAGEAIGMDWLAAPEAEAEAAPGEIPDWLAGAAPAVEAEPAGEAIGMDWLAAPEVEAEAAPGEVPDWLAGAAPAPEAEAEPAEAIVGMDWLAAPEAEAEAAPGEIPDWLAGAAPAPEAEAEPAEAIAGMDWLAAPEAEAEAAPGGIPDWLAMEAPDAGVEPEEEAVGADWLASMTEQPGAEAAPGGTPDWLAFETAEAEAKPLEEAAADWFTDMIEPQSAEIPPGVDSGREWPAAFEAEAAGEAEPERRPSGLTEWLVETGIERPAEPMPAPSEDEGALTEVEGLDWLTAFEPGYDPEAISAPSASAPAVDELEAPAGEEAEAAPEEADFLTALFASAEGQQAEAEALKEAPPAFEERFEAEPAEAIPDWLAAVAPSGLEAEPSEAERVEAADFLSALEAVTPAAAPEEAPPETLDIALTPRWLAQAGAAAEEPATDLGVDITPRWMRVGAPAAPAEVEAAEPEPFTPAWMARMMPPAIPEAPAEVEAEAAPVIETPVVEVEAGAPVAEMPPVSGVEAGFETEAPPVAEAVVAAPAAYDAEALAALERPVAPAAAPRVPRAAFAFEWLDGPPRAGRIEEGEDGHAGVSVGFEEFAAPEDEGIAPGEALVDLGMSPEAAANEMAAAVEATALDEGWAGVESDAGTIDAEPPEAPSAGDTSAVMGATWLAETQVEVEAVDAVAGAEDAGVSAVTDVNFELSAGSQQAGTAEGAEAGVAPADTTVEWLREPLPDTDLLSERAVSAGPEADAPEADAPEADAPEWLREAREDAGDAESAPGDDVMDLPHGSQDE